jgi:RNA polymerase sigma-70 factor (ECF subfamily)
MTSYQIDKNIIDGLNRGSPEAMKRLFELYYTKLCNYAVRYTANLAIAEEIVSDVMYKIWQNRHTCYNAETFLKYLYTATRNTALNYLKQKKNIENLADNWAEQLRHELIEETPLDVMIREELLSKFDSIMNRLPEQCRKVFLLSRMNDMSYEEIAIRMDISVNTVKYHIKTALLKLRLWMSDFLH